MSISLSTTEPELKQNVIAMASHINAAEYRFLLLIEEYDRRRLWDEWECRSMAHWLNWQCAMGMPTAREHVRIARALPALPLPARLLSSTRLCEGISQGRAQGGG